MRISDWSSDVCSSDLNRPMRMTVTYDMGTGREASREGFADGHVIDRVVGYGIAWHEGQLFGWVNQLVGVLTAIGLIMMAVSGFILWRRRKPGDVLGAPPPRSEEHTSELQSLLRISYAVHCL